ncbi:MAG: TonB family protein [Pseudomonadota bacterium]
MIRRSLIIAVVAALVSLLLHLLGITATTRVAVNEQAAGSQADVVELTNAFEDLAETEAEPAEPEPTEEPEPQEVQVPQPEEAEPPPEPEEAEAPPEPEEIEQRTSKVLVASANPRQTRAPDTGIVETGRRSTIGDAGTDDPGAPDPTAVQPAEGEAGEPSEPATAPPVTAEAAQNPPEGDPNSAEETPSEDNQQTVQGSGADEIEAAPEVAPEPPTEQLAALAAPSAPTPSVTVPVTPSAIPVIPLDTEDFESEPETPATDPAAEDAADAPEAEREIDLAAAAVTTSPRPRLRQPQQAAEPRGVRNSPQTLREFLQNPDRVIESPLTAYRREGVDPFLRGGGGNRGGSGFESARGVGNSDTTNYAGQVFVHLNRTRRIAVNARGWARVFFRINPDGSLAWVDVLDGSGSAEVNRGAKAQVRAAAPFPRPPSGQTRQLTFIYQSR